jgi:nucleoside-diphosphate-sugar epimerase
VVVNAAGLAEPGSRDSGALEAANAVLPVVVACAAARAGVPRMVQISTAAVQGRRAVLDETPDVEPVTAYGRSKAHGEAALLKRGVDRPDEVVVYRPTSVQGVDRAMTQRLVALADRGRIPICGRGDVPLPVALIDNVAAGIVYVCRSSSPPALVLQPWEGVTTRSLLTALGAVRLVALPSIFVRGLIGAARIASVSSARLGAATRRIELLAFGQRQAANTLSTIGFTTSEGIAGYAQLAREIRATRRGTARG